MKKAVSLLLLCAMLAVISVSCAKQAQTSGEQTSAAVTEAAETEPEKILPDLPELDMEDAEVRIMMYPTGGTDWQDWASRDIYADSQNGEVINDSVYSRNLSVEERFNCIIKGVEVNNQQDTIKKQVAAGTDDYHVSTCRMEGIKSMVREGYMVNLYSLEYVDLSRPWYDQQMVENGTILGQLYYVTGDMIIIDDDSTSAMVFSQALNTNYNYESPYDLVNNSEWTFDKMNEMITAAAADLDGDGEMTLDDQYGLIWQRDAIVSYLHAGGGRIVTIDSEGMPEITLNDEKNYGIMQKIFDIMYRNDIVINLHHFEGKQDIYQLQTKMFSEDRCYMMWIRMRVVETLRNMENDFGIIPLPKYTETQESYYHTVNRYTGGAVGVPNSAGFDPQPIGAVIEALSAESMYTLKEAYYDVNLGTKIARDPESTQMLDIIMSTRVYDTGELYDIGGLSWDMYTLTMTNKGDFASFIDKKMPAAEIQLEKFIADFEGLAANKG